MDRYHTVLCPRMDRYWRNRHQKLDRHPSVVSTFYLGVCPIFDAYTSSVCPSLGIRQYGICASLVLFMSYNTSYWKLKICHWLVKVALERVQINKSTFFAHNVFVHQKTASRFYQFFCYFSHLKGPWKIQTFNCVMGSIYFKYCSNCVELLTILQLRFWCLLKMKQ